MLQHVCADDQISSARQRFLARNGRVVFPDGELKGLSEQRFTAAVVQYRIRPGLGAKARDHGGVLISTDAELRPVLVKFGVEFQVFRANEFWFIEGDQEVI